VNYSAKLRVGEFLGGEEGNFGGQVYFLHGVQEGADQVDAFACPNGRNVHHDQRSHQIRLHKINSISSTNLKLKSRKCDSFFDLRFNFLKQQELAFLKRLDLLRSTARWHQWYLIKLF